MHALHQPWGVGVGAEKGGGGEGRKWREGGGTEYIYIQCRGNAAQDLASFALFSAS